MVIPPLVVADLTTRGGEITYGTEVMVHLRGAQVLGTPKKSSGYGRARVEVTIATRIH